MIKKIRVGVLMGGSSREREVSFAGGRTVCDNLDLGVFEPIPIFIDGYNRFILLQWQYLYRGTIRDFYPPLRFISKHLRGLPLQIDELGLDEANQINAARSIGQLVTIEELPQKIDIAFLVLHGVYGEDGTIQGILEWLKIPYTGAGILGSAIGLDKLKQRNLLSQAGLLMIPSLSVNLHELNLKILKDQITSELNYPCVIKVPTQGSSIGLTFVQDETELESGLKKASFKQDIDLTHWFNYDYSQKIESLRAIFDQRYGIGFPLWLRSFEQHEDEYCRNLTDLLAALDKAYLCGKLEVWVEAHDSPKTVLIEQFIEGDEFSIIVLEDLEGKPYPLLPTQIIKETTYFDYRGKYLSGAVRKLTPGQFPAEVLTQIQTKATQLKEKLFIDVYARIDGMIDKSGKIYFNDPNTTSGMLPSSFLFHQGAWAGFTPKELLSHIILTSLYNRSKTPLLYHQTQALLSRYTALIQHQITKPPKKCRVVVILGGYSSERHISVESGRNIYQKLATDPEFFPIPVFLKKSNDELGFSLWVLPVNLLLKDNADEISQAIERTSAEGQLPTNEDELRVFNLAQKPMFLPLHALKDYADFVFIGLHGRPGEDGTLQAYLESEGIPFNGSSSLTSKLTIHKYNTVNTLKSHGFAVADSVLITANTDFRAVASSLTFPVIAKPVDDGCSTGVEKLTSSQELLNYLDNHTQNGFVTDILVERYLPHQFPNIIMEITVGIQIYPDNNQQICFEVFLPSQTIATYGVLTLEEKFLAGEGQNITPAHFSDDPAENERITKAVQQQIESAARCLNLYGYARIDAFVDVAPDGTVTVIFIEVNSLPGMTPATCIFHQAALAGLSPIKFIKSIISSGQKRYSLDKKL